MGTKTFNRDLGEIKKRIQTKSNNEAQRSVKHFNDFQTTTKRVAEQKTTNRYKENERINSAMIRFNNKVDTGI